MKDYSNYDALGLAELVRKKDVSPTELLDAALTRAEAAQSDLNCFSALFPESASKQIEDGLPDGPFSGVPFVTKDLNSEITGAPLTNGSRSCRGNVAARDSEIITRYRKAGLTLFGQTTSPEFALTTTTESALYGKTRNPWNTEHSSGGSSGGASAAVAAGVIPIAQATDGGGSIRVPAACCGLFGMKPSRGRNPLGPVRTEGWNGLSMVHAVSRSVRDSAALMDATHGIETGARYIAPLPSRPFLDEVAEDPKPLRVAYWPVASNGTKPEADVQAGLDATVFLLSELGHSVEEAAPKLDGEALGKGMLMIVSSHMAATAEAIGEALGRTLGEDDLEPVSLRLAELGRTIPAMELAKADYAFIEAAIAMEQFMDAGNYDVILSPTLTRAPAPLGLLSLDPEDFDAYAEAVGAYAAHCPLYNQTGAPAMSVPLHWNEDGLPIGMMFAARYGSESLLFSLAEQLERAKPWFDKRPPVFVG